MVYGKNVVVAILGGGRGTRLFPLTKSRAKPAVPIGGKHRLIDIPISNCINSGFKKIFVLTQYESESLNRHVNLSYKFDAFSSGFVEILAAEQRLDSSGWYQGTADAVRQSLRHFRKTDPKYCMILSGDQLYCMNLLEFFKSHQDWKADISVAVKPVSREQASSFGLLKVNRKGKIIAFAEKPSDPGVLDDFRLDPNADETRNPYNYLASMGIYLFDIEGLEEVLSDETKTDFGKEIIPAALESYDVHAFHYHGYWEDIGTIKTFYKENIAMTDPVPKFNFFDPDFPIYTHARYLPPSKINTGNIIHSHIAEGSIINAETIERSVVGIRSVIGEGTVIKNSYLMGNDYFDFSGSDRSPAIGEQCHIENTIIDKNVHIEDGVIIRNSQGIQHADGQGYCIREGIVVIEKEALIPAGTEI